MGRKKQESCDCCEKKVPFIFDDFTELEMCKQCSSMICKKCNVNHNEENNDAENVLCLDCYAVNQWKKISSGEMK